MFKKLLLSALILFCPLQAMAQTVTKSGTASAVFTGLNYSSLSFDGATGMGQNDYVTIPSSIDNQIYGATSFSVEVWFVPRSLGENSTGRILDKMDGTSSTKGYRLFTNASRTIRFDIYGDGAAKQTGTSTAFNFGELVHVVATWVPGQASKVYINGQEASYSVQQSITSPVDDSAQNLIIGNETTTARTLDGNIAMVRIFRNKALSSSEVATLYGNGRFVQSQSSPVTGCTAEYNFSDGSGTTLTDSISGNNGTLGAGTNSPTWINPSQVVFMNDWERNPSDKLTQLFAFGGLTFYKDYSVLPTGTHAASDLNADFSIGSPTATFTATRSAAAPATYIDDNGVIQLVTTSDVARVNGGYYDSTGFHVYAAGQKGVTVEGSTTNLITRTDGTAYDANTWTGWTAAYTSLQGTPTLSVNLIPELTSIADAKSQRVQYTGIAGDSSASLRRQSPSSEIGSVVNGDTVTISGFIRSTTGVSGTSIKLGITARTAADGFLSSNASTSLSLTSNFRFFSYTKTITDATCSRIRADIGVFSDVNEGDLVDFEFYGIQVEKAPYATSFIPTTTAALTRGAETLTYAIAGNRNASAESVFVKFTPESAFENDGVVRFLTDTNTKRRYIRKDTTSTKINSYPNGSDNGSVLSGTSSTPAANTSLVSASVFQHLSPYSRSYIDGTSEGSYTTGDWTNPAWGANFYLGVSSVTGSQLNGHISNYAAFSNAKSTTDVSTITGALNQ